MNSRWSVSKSQATKFGKLFFAGQRICYDCIGEVYCDRCYKLVHQAGDLAMHNQYDMIK